MSASRARLPELASALERFYINKTYIIVESVLQVLILSDPSTIFRQLEDEISQQPEELRSEVCDDIIFGLA